MLLRYFGIGIAIPALLYVGIEHTFSVNTEGQGILATVLAMAGFGAFLWHENR